MTVLSFLTLRTFNFSVDHASFQVVDFSDKIVVDEFGVAHQDKVNWVEVFNRDLVNSVDSCNQRGGVFLDVLEIKRE